MKVLLRSARIAPKKANLIARMVRGMTVPDAVEALAHTNKKAARMIETLLRSAMANVSHNLKQNPQQMIIASIVVNQGTAYRRGMPKARGQTRPFRKFLSHIELVLGYPGDEKIPISPTMPRMPKSSENKVQWSKEGKSASQKAEKPVKDGRSTKTKKKNSSSESSESSVSSASSQ